MRFIISALALLGSLPAAAGVYQKIGEQKTNYALPAGQLELTETVVQDGPDAINRFRMHRLRRTNGPQRGAVLLLPALGNNFNGYFWHESGDVTKSFAAVLARAGHEVWGYSPRETGITPGACGGALDCSPALDWGLKTVVDDATYIRSQISAALPGKVPVIGGLSLGAISALAVLNQNPRDYAGLLAWEGSLVSADPLVIAHNTGFCNQYSAIVAAGIAIDDQNLPFVKLLAMLAQAAPNAPFALPVPGFPPGLTNNQAFVLVLSTPNPIAPSPRAGFITAAGDFASGQFFFSNKNRLTTAISTFNDATANRVNRDMHCALAGVETAFTANLSKFKGPVMIIKGGQGFGTIMDELPAKLGSTSVTAVAINAFAHIDHMGHPVHAVGLEAPILLWLNWVL